MSGPSLQQLQSGKVTVRVDVGLDSPVTVVYRPAALDQDTWERIRQTKPGAPDEQSHTWTSNQAPAFMLEVAAEWDLREKESDGSPIPITADGLRKVPTAVLKAIMDKINADLLPNPMRREPSDNGLPPEES